MTHTLILLRAGPDADKTAAVCSASKCIDGLDICHTRALLDFAFLCFGYTHMHTASELAQVM